MSFEVGGDKFRSYFFNSLASMLSAGIDIRVILDELSHEAKSPQLQGMIQKMRQDVENGVPVWKVMQEQKLVADQYLALIRIGEQSGNLSKNLELVVEQLERDKEFNSQLRSASLYPGIVFVLMLVVAMVMTVFVLPRIAAVYTGLKVELPALTRLVMGFGNFVTEHIDIVVPISIALPILVIYLIFFNKPVKRLLGQIAFRLPVIGEMLMELEMTRFGYMLSNLLLSGIQLTEAFRYLEQAASLKGYQQLYNYLGYYIEKGYNLENLLSGYPHINRYIPLYPRQLIINGERSRQLPENLHKIGVEFQRRNGVSVKNIGTLIEPVLLLVVWAGVAVLAISIIMPIYGILGQINDASSGSTNPPAEVEETVTPTDVVNDVDELQPQN